MRGDDFFDFSTKPLSSTIQAHPEKIFEVEKLTRGDYQEIVFPVVFRQEYGKNLRDMLDTGCVSLFLISDRMKSVLEEHQFTGWKTFPVKIFDKKEKEITGYHGLSVTGRSGPRKYNMAAVVERPRNPGGPLRKFYKGATIENWGGDDFFIPEDTIAIIVTRKVVDALHEHKFTNLSFVNLLEREYSAIAIDMLHKD